MTFKEFKKWVNERWHDGCWGANAAGLCMHVCTEIQKVPFWKREKAWKQEEYYIVNNIVIPINTKIEELTRKSQ